MNPEQRDAAAIFLTHGIGDSISTILAYRSVGSDGEANPVIRYFLEIGEIPAAMVILVAVGVASILWPTAARSVGRGRSRYVAAGIVTLSVTIVTINLVVALDLL